MQRRMNRSIRRDRHLSRLITVTTACRRAAFGIALMAADATAHETTRVSVDSAGTEANGSSFLSLAGLSADGQVIAFQSSASNLVAGDTNGIEDVFVHDRATGLTHRVSVDSAGGQMDQSSAGYIEGASISGDGRFVAFSTDASDLVAGDTNGGFDIFVHDLATGVTERVSVDSAGAEADFESYEPSLSANGQFVVFASAATNLIAGDTNGVTDVFVHDRASGTTERVSVATSGTQGALDSYKPTISADGQVVAFFSQATTFASGDTNNAPDIFVHERATGLTTCVSVDSAGGLADGASDAPSISADGKVVAFESDATNLVAGDSNGTTDIFVHERASGTTRRVSVDSAGAQGAGSSSDPALSSDGRFVALRSSSDQLVPGDGNGVSDTFVHDCTTGLIERVSVDSAGVEGNGVSYHPSLSADGQIVAYYSFASNLVAGDANVAHDVFVHSRCVDASWSTYGVGFAGTNGIPAFTAQGDPLLGTTVTVALANSSNATTLAYVLIGGTSILVPTGKGGDLLVAPSSTIVLVLPTGGATIDGDIADDEALCGLELFLQALELDPGAQKGVSFTAGLNLVIGR